METENPTATANPTADATGAADENKNGTAAAPSKRYRATKIEMAEREDRAVEALKEKPLSLSAVARIAELSHPKAKNLVLRLVREGIVEEAGEEGRATLYAYRGGATPRTQTKVPTKRRELPPIDIAGLMNDFQIGRKFAVVGIEVTERDRFLQLRPENGKGQVFKVAIAS